MVSLCRFVLEIEMGRKQTLIFPPSIHWIYKWVDPKVLGILSRVSSELLKSLKGEHLPTSKGDYEKDYVLKVPHVDVRMCYINHGSGLNWMWMYDVLISKFGILIPFTHFQFTILKRIQAASSQLYPISWVMIRGFEIVC